MTRPYKPGRKVYRRAATGWVLYGVGPVPFKQCSRCEAPRERMCEAHRRETQNRRNRERNHV